MKVLVTGGCGFIGSNLVDRLVQLKHDVVVIDNLSSTVHEQFYFNDSAQYHHVDIADFENTNHLYKNVDTVFHLAAQSRIQLSIDDPVASVKTNTVGTASVLEAARMHNVRRVIYSSTSSSYGLKNSAPQTESMPKDCLNTYSVSKTFGEELCAAYTNMFGLETVTFRYFNVYGPREPIKGPYAPVIGLFIRQFKNNEPLTIVPDGLQRRDFTHVSDVVEANILAMHSNLEKYGEIFNIGAGKNYSVKEIADMISSRQKIIEPRIGEARETLANISKARTLLGWNPTKNLVNYIEENLN
jgi:nucleoside-diphosphate-sugar epimerase